MSWSLCIVLTVAVLSATGLIRRWIEHREVLAQADVDRLAIMLADRTERSTPPPSPN